jgi:hypothetical protein
VCTVSHRRCCSFGPVTHEAGACFDGRRRARRISGGRAQGACASSRAKSTPSAVRRRSPSSVGRRPAPSMPSRSRVTRTISRTASICSSTSANLQPDLVGDLQRDLQRNPEPDSQRGPQPYGALSLAIGPARASFARFACYHLKVFDFDRWTNTENHDRGSPLRRRPPEHERRARRLGRTSARIHSDRHRRRR